MGAMVDQRVLFDADETEQGEDQSILDLHWITYGDVSWSLDRDPIIDGDAAPSCHRRVRIGTPSTIGQRTTLLTSRAMVRNDLGAAERDRESVRIRRLPQTRP